MARIFLPSLFGCVVLMSGCASLCNLRDPQTGKPLPPQFTGTVGTIARQHPMIPSAVLQSVSTVQCDRFDRVVFAFDRGVPSYRTEYIDKPIRDCGAGNVIPVAGDAWLQVHFTSAQAHTDAGQSTVADRNRMLNYSNLKQIVDTCDFEGNVTWVLGVGSPQRYRVTELASPPRVVVDVLH